MSSVFLGTPDGDVHPCTTGNVHPDMTKTLTAEALCQSILGSIDLNFHNYVTVM
jgi:hypothetical protein